MFIKLSKHRKFEYLPLYWDPEKEEREKGRKRIRFRRTTARHAKMRSYFWLIIMLGFIMYILYLLSRVAKYF